jgi:hypothetical protein
MTATVPITFRQSIRMRPTPPLAWQRYPHVDGFVEPWTSGGTLRAGLRFAGEGRGPCFVVAETVESGISCVARNGERWDACFPQRRPWRAGDVAACGELGETRFVRWTITARRWAPGRATVLAVAVGPTSRISS